MIKVGYARVSSTDQNLARQIKALKATGCEKHLKKSNQVNQRRTDQNYRQQLLMCDKAIRWSLYRWISLVETMTTPVI